MVIVKLTILYRGRKLQQRKHMSLPQIGKRGGTISITASIIEDIQTVLLYRIHVSHVKDITGKVFII